MAKYVDEHGYEVYDDTIPAALGPRLAQISRAIKRLQDARERLLKSNEAEKTRIRGEFEQYKKKYWLRKPPPLVPMRVWRKTRAPVSMKKPTNFKQVPWNKNQQAGWQKFVQSRKK